MEATKLLTRTPQANVPEDIDTYDVVVPGPHSVQLRRMLTERIAKAKGADKKELELMLELFEENHTRIRYSRNEPQRNDDGTTVKKDGKIVLKGPYRDEKTGKLTLDPCAAGVWSGPRDLKYPSEDLAFFPIRDGQQKGLFFARTYFKTKLPRYLFGANNPPQVFGIHKEAVEQYQADVEAAEAAQAEEPVETADGAPVGAQASKTPPLTPPAK